MTIENSLAKLAASIDNLTTMIATLRESYPTTASSAPTTIEKVEQVHQVESPVPMPQGLPTGPIPVQVDTRPPLTLEQVNMELATIAGKIGDGGQSIFAMLNEQYGGSLKDADPSKYYEIIDAAKGLPNAQ